MRLIDTIINKNYKTISIIGLAKNSGKTVTLNYLIEESLNKDIKIGLTSIGRDGENIDIVTNTNKPSIYVSEGIFVATAKSTLLFSEAKGEILETTGINTPMGEVIIMKIRQSGNIQIAGPVNTRDLKYINKRLQHYGADVVYIDGAIDRKSSSSPLNTDGCIIATGAVISRDMKTVIEKTAYTAECLNLEEINEEVKNLINEKYSCIIDTSGNIVKIQLNTSINSGKKICGQINEDTLYLFIKGAITTSLLKELSNSMFLKSITIIIEDGTKIFTDPNTWQYLKRKGMKIKTLNSIDVLAITINPVSPEGYFFDSGEFKNKMKKYLPEYKIIDVLSGGEEH